MSVDNYREVRDTTTMSVRVQELESYNRQIWPTRQARRQATVQTLVGSYL